jgi:short-subunit dehydrogenase
MTNVYSITGASGDVAKHIIDMLNKTDNHLHLYSTRKNTFEPSKKLFYNELTDYLNIDFLFNSNKLLVCNGVFKFGKFISDSNSSIADLVTGNFTSILQIVNQYLKATESVEKKDIYILGSTAAYDLGANVAVYAASKFGLRGFVTSLNKEYSQFDTRFTLISFGTVDNEMGLKVPNQEQNTLLKPQKLAEQIVSIMESKLNIHQPEIILRRRFTQAH